MPGEDYQLFVKGLEGGTTIIRLQKDATIAQLRKVISDKTGVPDEELRVLYTTKELRSVDPDGKQQTLVDYNIENESNLVVVLRLRGGSTTDEPFVKVLPEDAEVTEAPDMITLDDDTDSLRAKMPCGHGIGPESLTAYCRSILTADKKYEFRCPFTPPYCGQLWDFYTVNRLAVLTPEERKEFEEKVAENYLRKAVHIQDCPGCMSYCERLQKTDVRVICPLCTKKQGKLYEFCWYCLKTWLTGGTDDCGNASCPHEDPRKKVLRNCQMKVVVEVPSCPSVRACPTCGMLIEHMSACKQMICPCGQKFCFICLKKANSSGKYQCGTWNFKCTVAAIQTTLPES